jgi:methylmalonyl-CoA/ethylmalonyl-CoA epimerase
MIGRLNHIGIAVPDLEKAAALYRDVLGATVSAQQPLPSHGVTVVFVDLPNVKLELLQPLGDASPMKGFLEKNPPSARMTSRCCSCIPRIWTDASWS